MALPASGVIGVSVTNRKPASVASLHAVLQGLWFFVKRAECLLMAGAAFLHTTQHEQLHQPSSTGLPTWTDSQVRQPEGYVAG